MHYQIRQANTDDVVELARLRWDSRVEEQANQSYQEFVRTCAAWLEQALSSGRWIIAVASTPDGSLCGCMYLQYVEKVPVPGKINRAWGYVTNSYVSPEQRGRGIGGQLLNLLIDTARRYPLEFLIVWPSEEAVSLYQRAGFRLASEVHDHADDYPPLELVLNSRQ
jgi:ribosomal protein S18 acetylase RimI-like enzyme